MRPLATPAELPLKGGQPGATLTLHPLLSAEIVGPPNWFHRGRGPLGALRAIGVGVPLSEQITVPVPAFLLEHPSAGPILVDTGFHASVATAGTPERARNLGRVGSLIARNVRMRPEQAVAAQLRARGLDPDEVRLVVMTHMHFDHASALCDFPGATVLTSAPEWEAVWGRGSALRGYSTAQFDPRPSYRTVDFSGPHAGALDAFERTVDVFGDGSLVLAFTPGHTRGHVSAIARLEGREALLAGDAIYTIETLRNGKRPWLMDDSRAFEHSLSQLQAWDRGHPGALIVPGHDMGTWQAVCATL
jgi:N-acyl homoserine lactone hydrolase